MGSTRRLFLSLLGVVHLCAFGSLAVQVVGLVGEKGLLPVGELLQELRAWATTSERLAEAHHDHPTLCWLDASDLSLKLQCGAGIVLALLLVVGMAPMVVLPLLWALYLSLTVAGQDFLSFQWDMLLLETTFFAIWLAPWGLLPWGAPRWILLRRRNLLRPLPPPPTKIAVCALRLLLFRFMFASGYVKLSSGDANWRDLGALTFHYWSQPLPTPLAWFVHQLPRRFHEFSCASMLALEMGAPLLLFVPGRLRWIGRRLFGFATIGLMFVIGATGNYGFFEPLTVVLALLLFDRRVAPSGYDPSPEVPRSDLARPDVRRRVSPEASECRSRVVARIGRGVTATIAGAASLIALMAFGTQLVSSRPELSKESQLGRFAGSVLDGIEWACARPGDDSRRRTPRLAALHQWIAPFGSINTYGLFRVMTTQRQEIVLEGSDDAESWRPYVFRFKPGDPSEPPCVCPLHMPRLDWQMWFASFEWRRQLPGWYQRLVRRLLEGEPSVLALLAEDPFGGKPPRFVRATFWDYRFTTSQEREATGDWWSRREIGLYSPPVSLR